MTPDVAPAATATPDRGFFPARDGLQLYHETWPGRAPVRATVAILHGYGDHSGRFQNPINVLTGHGFDVCAFDYRGHGQAGGRRGHVDRFGEYLDDLGRCLEVARRRTDGSLFILGHSFGGLIAVRYLLEHQQGAKGVILSSPFIGLSLKVPAYKAAIARALSRYVPRLTMKNGVNPALLSRDPGVAAAYARDHFVHHVATARWFTETLAAQDRALADAARLTLPLLMLLGDADGIAAPERSRTLFERLGSEDKTLNVYAGGYHELMNDTVKERVLTDVVAWLEKRA
ncbi:MAG TPA: alpha/beta hydrolase [Polyangia bacterium]|jgi:alpha-beta hydrolase superfamily lysophospholipase